MSISHRKVNPEDDLGFGTQPVMKNQPLLNRDGSVNVRRPRRTIFNTTDNYHILITMSWGRFWALVFACYLTINIVFASVYTAIGVENLNGADGHNAFEHFMDAFFFSAQTISTVGYGHISPRGMLANSVAALESMMGLIAFALATGLLYGRFSRPSAKIRYSRNIIVAPYIDGKKGLMFRLANERRNLLIDLNAEVIFSYNEDVNGKPVRRFFPLALERKRVSLLTISWTIVHPLDDHSPLKDMTRDDLINTEASFSILIKAFDDTFSQTVHSRAAYMHNDIVWGAKFKPTFERDPDGRLFLDIGRINHHEPYEFTD